MNQKTCRSAIVKAVNSGKLPREYLLYEDIKRRTRHVDTLCEGALRGRDIEAFSSLDEWIDWLRWSTVVLDENDYLEAAVHALDLAPRLAGTDYGMSRQRDLGQLWTDTIRGFLGELAFVKWLEREYGIKAMLDYRKGPLEEFLPSDIKEVEKDEVRRPPNLKVSIKTTKLRGIWLDVPYRQVDHSDVFVLVRVGVTRMHFLAFLKRISAIRDKMLRRALELGVITEGEAESIWDLIPDFTGIPAYIAGFFDKREYGSAIGRRTAIFLAEGVMKRKKFVINKFIGYWNPKEDVYKNTVVEHLQRRGVIPSRRDVKIEFEGIGEFTKTLHFLVSSGALRRKREEWERIISQL
ncbi:hypothetical protein apy_08910 [Aeropyrum pernix]|uniref:Uncharacterized protein n=1 Tax=Aeropyrum pernix TaxID=56636 RepID=A0A401H9M5_AERPX|nr:hypothetical protein [Aeropyrum pernix]GBF09166.1 hypothetical protein apy_08910 [Aeropyrum pernix]